MLPSIRVLTVLDSNRTAKLLRIRHSNSGSSQDLLYLPVFVNGLNLLSRNVIIFKTVYVFVCGWLFASTYLFIFVPTRIQYLRKHEEANTFYDWSYRWL